MRFGAWSLASNDNLSTSAIAVVGTRWRAAMAQPLDAAELQILEDTDLNHKWYKRYIKALVDQENLAATDWKTAQNEHMRVSL